jgi:glutamate racemase
MTQTPSPAAIGVFDSGVGGLSVLREIRQQLPCHPILYLADQGHVPYGVRTQAEVRAFAEGISRFLLDAGARVIVVACNAASAAALQTLRATFPDVPFVGMEPAVKPAAAATRSGLVGVLATPVTFQGALYASVVDRFARGITVLQDTCPGLVGQIEAGRLASPETRAILENALRPMLSQGVDTVVMGCTHYPFVIPLIEEIAGPGVQVIDPAPAVARQVGRVLEGRGLLASCENPAPWGAKARFFTTGDPSRLREMLPILLGEAHDVQYLQWETGKLY